MKANIIHSKIEELGVNKIFRPVKQCLGSFFFRVPYEEMVVGRYKKNRFIMKMKKRRNLYLVLDSRDKKKTLSTEFKCELHMKDEKNRREVGVKKKNVKKIREME